MPPLLADFMYTRICKLICAKFLTLPRGTSVTHYFFLKLPNARHTTKATVFTNTIVAPDTESQ